MSLSPLRNDKEEVIGCVIAVRDLREVETLRSRLVTSDRLAAVGELAAGIAHEINNPITFVRANLVALREDWGGLNEAADEIDRSVDLDMAPDVIGKGAATTVQMADAIIAKL